MDPIEHSVASHGSNRRCWPEEEKPWIIQESLAPRARICGVARRKGVKAQQLSAWPPGPTRVG